MVITPNEYIKDLVLFIRDDLRSNITDPLSRTDGIGFVLTAYGKRQTQYPIITVQAVGSETIKLGMQSEVSQVNMTLEIRIWGRTSQECDDLTAKTIDRLRSIQYGANSTTNEGIYNFKLNSMVPVVEDIDGENRLHSKVLEFMYMSILN